LGLCFQVSLVSKFGKQRLNLDKVSSRSRYESAGGLHQESEKMLCSRYD
jgi:hypothetical protein